MMSGHGWSVRCAPAVCCATPATFPTANSPYVVRVASFPSFPPVPALPHVSSHPHSPSDVDGDGARYASAILRPAIHPPVFPPPPSS